MTFHSFCYALLRNEQASDALHQPDAAAERARAGRCHRRAAPRRRPDRLAGASCAGPAHPRPGHGAAAADGVGARARHGRRSTSSTAGARARPRRLGSAPDASSTSTRRSPRSQNTIDHTDLIFQAVRLLDDPDARERWRSRFRLVVVDEYQDTDPLQVQLLQALAGDGRDLVAVGDPYQSIYGFRGADVRGILDFPHEFGIDGRPAPVIVAAAHPPLRPAHRAPPCAPSCDGRGALGRGRRSARTRQLRTRVPRGDDRARVEVRTFASPTAEAEHIALLLREAHLHDDVAVVATWPCSSVPGPTSAGCSARSRAAGVPVEVAGDEVPLALEPPSARCWPRCTPPTTCTPAEPIDPGRPQALLTGPLGGLDAASMRRLGRALRQARARPPPAVPAARRRGAGRPGRARHVDATGHARRRGRRAARAGSPRLLRQAADARSRPAMPPNRCSGPCGTAPTGPSGCRPQAEAGGDGATQANHDLDALCALFAEAARAEEQHGPTGRSPRSSTALRGPADPGRHPRPARRRAARAVQLMTAHRSKGLEWPLVVVAGVQDGEWPDARRAQQPAAGRAARRRRRCARALGRARWSPRSDGCSTSPAAGRATRLVVTAVASGSDDGDQPSRFVGRAARPRHGAAGRTLPERRRTGRGARCRCAVRSPSCAVSARAPTSPTVRARAAVALADVVAPAGRPAHPDRWWGLRELTEPRYPSATPASRCGCPAARSPRWSECPLKWFLVA